MTEQTYSKPEADNYNSKVKLVIFIVITSLLIAVIVPSFLDIIVAAGNNVVPYAGEDLVTDYVLGILWAAILGMSILFWPVSSKDKRALLRIWLIKAIVALVLMLAYEYQYALDIDGYFGHAVSPDFIWSGFSFSDGTRNMHHLVWLHLQIVPGSYHASKVGFALIGLFGIYLFYRAAVIFLCRENIRILYILALFPGILFWSSILGKDPITLLGFSLYVYGVVAWQRLNQPRHLITSALGILIASIIRVWLIPITILPLLILIIIGQRSFIWRAIVLVFCVLTMFIVLPHLQDMGSIATTESLFEFRDYATGGFIGGGSSYESPKIAGFNDLIKALPLGIFSALFRPLPWDVSNLFGLLQSLDGFALLILLVMSVKRTRLKELKEPLLLWVILLTLTWAAFYGLTAFNFGTLVRYKLMILPVLLGLLLYLSRHRARTVLQVDKK